MGETTTPPVLAVVLSLLLHAAIGLGIGAGPGFAAAPRVDPLPIDIEVRTVPPPRREPELAPPPLPPPPVPGGGRVPLRRPRERVPVVVAPGLPPAPAPAPEPAPARPRQTPAPRPAVPIDPASAAMAAVGIDRPPAPETTAERGRRLAADLENGLAREANTPGHVSRRPPPELRPQGDGYAYDGHAFSARVEADGSVSFSDNRVEGETQPGSVGMRFDLNDMLMRRRGQDPYAAERRWFMEQTEETRDRLAAEAQANVERRAVRGLRGRLERIWADAAAPAAARRRRIFRMWDDCADDEVGRRGRAAIERFIRQRLPAGSAEAFTPGEITRLNAGRVSEDRFDPYR